MDRIRRDVALSNVRTRLAAVERSGDAATLFDDEAVRDAAELVEYAREHPGDALLGLAAAGRLFWKRYLSVAGRGRGTDNPDFVAVLALLAPVYAADRAAVPQPLWRTLREVGDDFTRSSLVEQAPDELLDGVTAVLASGSEHAETAALIADAAMVMLPRGHPVRPLLASELAVALDLRYEREEAREHLDRAVAVAAEAAEESRGPVPLSRLGLISWRRYTVAGERADLDRAVAANRAAADAARPSDPSLAGCLHNLSLSLGSLADATDDVDLFEEAVLASREAVELTGPDDRMVLHHTVLLVSLLTDRHRVHGARGDLDEALRIGRAAIASARFGAPGLDTMRAALDRAEGRHADLP
ncbi:tetratricopeptide repeat protein [Actinomadura opuntiae]|uniref:tetratricopeptide repeat protein n=1 Tax=Actinomadura sp. OS1-43 TaxID=604315 RepID=UPI00255B0A73|nr:tetratricopeptide repeat protein [Actinomadura sp. OS1-43]MDL4813753.1 tetratricopeptide repeat protein [Actinomadura sp. OS1-43]